MFKYRVKETTIWINKLISTHESGSVIGLPMSGKLRTIESSIDLLHLNDQFLVIDLSIVPTKLSSLVSVLKPKISKFISSGGKIIYLENCSINTKTTRRQLKAIHSIRLEASRSFIYIYSFNEDITLSQDLLLKYSYLHPLTQNTYLFPYANKTEINQLVEQNENRFGIKLTEQEIKNIYTDTSGIPFLVKSYFRDKHGLDQSIRELVSQFSPQQLIDLKTQNKLHLASYHGLGLVDEKGQFYSHQLGEEIKNAKQSSTLAIDIEKQHITINDIPITNELNSYEKEIILRLYDKHRLSREEIAIICYGSKKSNEYSDYAIDKIISRLRHNLSNLGLDPKVIKTNRGYGYCLSNHDG